MHVCCDGRNSFRQGCMLYGPIPNMTERRLLPLMQRFGGTFHRPYRQGHPRRTSRCSGGGYRTCASSRRKFRTAAVARHDSGFLRSGPCSGPYVADGQQFPGRVLDRGHSGIAVADGSRSTRTRAAGRTAQGTRTLEPAEPKPLGTSYWWVVGFATSLTPARFGEASLVLRAQTVGLSLVLVPLGLVVINVVYALAAYPAGALPDRCD